MGAAILDRKSWGPPSWIGRDVIGAIVAPILLLVVTCRERADLLALVCEFVTFPFGILGMV